MRLTYPAGLTSADLDAWRRLSARAVEPNPFLEPGFLPAAARHLGGRSVALLVDEHEGSWSGCLAVKAAPARGRPIALSTWRHHYTYLGTPLVDRDRIERFSTALAESVASGEQARFLALRQVGDGPVLAAIRAAAAATGVASVFEKGAERAVYRPEAGVEFRDRVKPSRRKKLEAQRRRLAKKMDGNLATVEREDFEVALHEFLDLELASWKGKAGTAIASNPDSREFFVEMCRGMHDSGHLLFRSLLGSERALAMTCVLRADGVEFGFKTAFDEAFKSYSPGLVHLFDVLMEEGDSRQMMDGCGDADNETLNALYPDRRSLVTLTLGPPGRLDRLAGDVLEAAYSPGGRKLAAKLSALSASARVPLASLRPGRSA